MALFTKMYDMALRWSRHPHAERYLAALSFTESSFFPIPPDVMLAPMSMTKPKKALRFALITTIASVLGGVFGYAIGAMFYHQFLPLFEQLGWSSHFATIDEWFSKWGVLAVLLQASLLFLIKFLLLLLVSRAWLCYLLCWLRV